MILFICLLLELLSAMEVDLFVPSLPLLQEYFGLTPFLVELTLGINLSAYCLASFCASPISEYFGKKNTILIGCILFVIGSFFCSFATNYVWMLSGRFLQGMGISLPCVLAYVIVTDHYSEEQQTRFMGYMNATITLGMAIAPLIGSFVADAFGWRGNFHTLTIFGILSLVFVWIFLPKDKPQKDYLPSFSSYKPILTSQIDWILMISIVFMFLGYWIFIALSPILYIEVFKIDLIHFGYYQGSLTFVFALVSLFGGRLIGWMGEEKAMRYSLGITFFSGFLILLCIAFDAMPLFITISLCFHLLGTALPIIILWPLFMNLTKDYKTQRSSLITALRLISSAVFLQLVSYFYDQTFFYIGLSIMFISFISYPLLMYAYKRGMAYKLMMSSK